MKYVHVYENEIVYKYEDSNPIIFGGPWQHGESLQVPEEMDLDKVIYEDGEIKEIGLE